MKKKILALLVALTLICSMFATVSVSAASDMTLSMQSLGGTQGWTANGYPSAYAFKFGYGGVLSLGNLDLSGYDTIKVTYATDPMYFSAKSGAMEMNACFAVYSVNRSVGWPTAGGEHNAEGLLAKADTTAGPGTQVAWSACERTVNIDVSDVDYSGNVYLSHYNPTGHEALVVGIKLIAKTGGAVTPPPSNPGTYDAKINLDKMNISCWTTNTTIIFDNDYTGTAYRGMYHNTIVCTYSETEGAYVVTSKSIPGEPAGNLNSETLADNQIVIDATDTDAISANQAGWDAVQVGSLIYLEGVDLEANTADAGAFAGIVNKGGVDIPDAPVPPISAITTSIDFSSTDGSQTLTGGGCGGSTTYTFPGTFDITESVGFGGWAATPNGVAKYQYSIDGENFYDIADASITERPDLAGANISYPEGHSTAGFVVTVPVTAFNNGTNTLTIRLIDTQDGYFDIIKATVIINDDNNNDNINSDNSENVGTDDSVAVVFVMMVAIVAMAAVVIKRRKENI